MVVVVVVVVIGSICTRVAVLCRPCVRACMHGGGKFGGGAGRTILLTLHYITAQYSLEYST